MGRYVVRESVGVAYILILVGKMDDDQSWQSYGIDVMVCTAFIGFGDALPNLSLGAYAASAATVGHDHALPLSDIA